MLVLGNTHFHSNQVKVTVQGFVNLDQNVPQFKEHLRDFLVQIRVNLPITNMYLLFRNHPSSHEIFSSDVVNTKALEEKKSIWIVTQTILLMMFPAGVHRRGRQWSVFRGARSSSSNGWTGETKSSIVCAGHPESSRNSRRDAGLEGQGEATKNRQTRRKKNTNTAQNIEWTIALMLLSFFSSFDEVLNVSRCLWRQQIALVPSNHSCAVKTINYGVRLTIFYKYHITTNYFCERERETTVMRWLSDPNFLPLENKSS